MSTSIPQPATPTIQERSAYLEVILAFSLTVALLGAVAAQILIRSKLRITRVGSTAKPSPPRLYASIVQQRAPESDARAETLQASIALLQHRPHRPPATDPARLSGTVRDSRDARSDALAALHKIRRVAPPALAHASMRSIVAYLGAAVAADDAQRFLHVFESVLIGPRAAYVSADDLSFMNKFAYLLTKEFV